ncbi:glycosyltransferase family 2 protein [Paraflavitalea speifideaquila]|uniref:glycosyltransferase family 2 protein n=1 Tax=Paraflavitalea speifideaquila TaxID=3076558 RepID=UPI0028EE7090|nr:glycosyltransferase family 2 protein [Paraflavitalea speifideiaquila]
MSKQQPLVSCIMPTYNRRSFVPHAIKYFLRQDYENKELIIIDDSIDAIEDLVPDISGIRYYHLDAKITLGAKLNLACEYASGSIIANWDDDDWYAPRRLTYQVNALESADIDICGINKLLYFDLRHKLAYRYVYPPDQRIWLLGSSLCYKKESWRINHFADINVGMDGLFVWKIPPHRVRVLPDSTMSVHMIHNNNVSPKQTHDSWWHTYPVEEIKTIMGADWNFYSNDNYDMPNANAAVRTNHCQEDVEVHKPVRNIYACLVHENENCIIDVVRNLHYHDPASIILLYNGSEKRDLVHPRFSFEKYGAVIHPKPVPVVHGYLHSFALAAMQFALDNFAFDCLTIVDSDQLAIRSGYSSYLGQFLSSQPNAGILSRNAEKINRGSNVNHVAAQAFNEYDLWKPLLDSFADGHNKFVYWTFWPSTVFTSAAARGLTQLFTTNKLLQEIIQRSKIWASEEVTLPTLVSLLGYEIVSNPCSYDYVNYRKAYTLRDLDKAFDKKTLTGFILSHGNTMTLFVPISGTNSITIQPGKSSRSLPALNRFRGSR